MSNTIKPILKYPGAKWRLASWIISFFPEHLHYVEPYCGSAAIFFSKTPSVHEVLNDKSANIVNLFRVIRTRSDELIDAIEMTPWSEEEYALAEDDCTDGDELEQARLFLVRCWQMHGTQLGKSSNGWRHNGLNGHAYPTRLWNKLPERLLAVVQRLKQAEIRNRDALEVIEYYNAPDTLLYVDPPYILSTRLSEGHYEYEMTDDQHVQMLEVLNRHTGPVVLSGYPHSIYDDALQHWHKATLSAVAEHGRTRTEVLWINPLAAQSRQLSLFDDGGAA